MQAVDQRSLQRVIRVHRSMAAEEEEELHGFFSQEALPILFFWLPAAAVAAAAVLVTTILLVAEVQALLQLPIIPMVHPMTMHAPTMPPKQAP